jgi:L-ascorbate metabolism protein UlaG (beta-lactamase superfamily)
MHHKHEENMMKLRYFGHSAFELVTQAGTRILIDPFLDDNPLSPVKSSELTADYIIVTHAHGDHLGDTAKIATTASTVICVPELAGYLQKQGLNTHAMQIGGAFDFDFGKVKLCKAEHGSLTPDGKYAGLAAGVILIIEDKTIYHAGDTGIFGDMKLIAELHPIDYFLVPIGGNYTMDIPDAALAASWIRPKLAIPMHYNTFPLIAVNPEDFITATQKYGVSSRIMKPGEIIKL